MKKIIIAPDSFKGCMTSETVTDIIADAVLAKTDYEPVRLPIADGGEGSTRCIIKALGGTLKTLKVHSAENKLIDAVYGITAHDTAVLEIAETSGITKQTSYNALAATTVGYGELIKAALDEGCRRFLLCLGGSATTDCGAGMAHALGVKFIAAKGNDFVPVGGTLSKVAKIDLSGLDERIKESRFLIMSDVDNPLYGPNGAAYVYGPQKGASEEDIVVLDNGLSHIASLMKKAGLIDCDEVVGAGAAGGLGYACTAYFNGVIQSGINAILNICNFDEMVKDAAMVVSGEGKLDSQSLMGKVVGGISKRCGDRPLIVFCGRCDLDGYLLMDTGIRPVEIGRGKTLEDSIQNGAVYLKEKAEEFFAEYTENEGEV